MSIQINDITVIDDSRNANVGIITANQFSGSGDNLIFSPTITSFSPVDGSTETSLDTNIVLTFDQPIYAGVGSVFLRNSSGIGTIIEAIGIGSTSQITFNNQTLTINPTGFPTGFLPTNTNIYVVLPQGVVTNAVGGNIASVSTYNFTTTSFALTSINPANGATNVGIDTNITLTFTGGPTLGTGTIELRSGSTSGTLIESFDAASSPRISVAGNDWILDPTNDLGFITSVHTIIPSTAITNYVGLNTTGADTHSFTTRDPNLGEPYEGGFLVCQSGSTRWIVAPSSSQVARTWYDRNDANTRAQQVSGCTGWFVPTCAQLINPADSCKSYWDSYDNATYWSSTEASSSGAWFKSFYFGYLTGNYSKFCNRNVRSFRCVTY